MKDLMVRGATLEVPPPSSGLEQIYKDKVIVTKKIAYAQIHVERTIGQMRVFSILTLCGPMADISAITRNSRFWHSGFSIFSPQTSLG